MGVLRERHDAATGLASAAAFERAVTRCLAARAGGALLHIELDDLRGIDASFGLRAGDAIVSRVAELIGRRLNENGRACRFPDARFAVLLPDRSEAEALAFGNELAARVAALDYRCNDRAVAVSLRWGVAAPPAGATAARHWIAAAADRASAFGVADTSSTYNGVPV
jgi:diguanylate cyclase (GGDEF)-like protein